LLAFTSTQQKEVAMLRKVTVFALLFAVILASFPTNSVFAATPVKDPIAKLEAKWDDLVERYDTQKMGHLQAHKMADNWLKKEKKATVSQKAEVERHLALCNSSLKSAEVLIAKHAGFDRDGRVIDRVLARKTVVQLANYLNLHARSFKDLKVHTGN
jgi:hypothetical protein